MATDNPILRAQEIIGSNKPDDYVIQPSKHADELRTTAPALAAILDSSLVKVTSQQFEKKDQKALEAQREFTRIFNRANKLVLATAILTALVLTVGILNPLLAGNDKFLLLALSIGSVITGSFASKDLYMVRQGRLLEEWMIKRAEAESKRLDYFSEIANADAPAGQDSEVPLYLLKLEYFRRYQFDVQLAYFNHRGERHRKDSNENLSRSGIAIAGGAIVTGVAGVLTSNSAYFAALASLGAVFTAYSAYVALKEQIYQSQRISERYAATADQLEDIKKRLDVVRDAVLQSGQEPLQSFVAAVHEKLIAEHKQWLGEQEQRSSTLVKLDELLQQAMDQKEKEQQKPPQQAPQAEPEPEPEPSEAEQPEGSPAEVVGELDPALQQQAKENMQLEERGSSASGVQPEVLAADQPEDVAEETMDVAEEATETEETTREALEMPPGKRL